MRGRRGDAVEWVSDVMGTQGKTDGDATGTRWGRDGDGMGTGRGRDLDYVGAEGVEVLLARERGGRKLPARMQAVRPAQAPKRRLRGRG